MLYSVSSYRNSLVAGLTLLLAVLCVGRVEADPLSITLDSTGAGADVTTIFNGQSSDSFAGQFNVHVGNGPEVVAFCVDYAHNVSVGQKYLVNTSTTDSSTDPLVPNGGQIAYLMNTFGSGPLTDTQAAGLQIAIWDLLYDNGAGLTSGMFQYLANDAIAAAANTYLSDALGQSSSTTWYDASPSGGDVNRGQSLVIDNPPPAPTVPESSTILLFGGCLGGLGLSWVARRFLLFRIRTSNG